MADTVGMLGQYLECQGIIRALLCCLKYVIIIKQVRMAEASKMEICVMDFRGLKDG